MPDRPPFHRQNLVDARLNPRDNARLAENYFAAVKAAQRSHEILAIFGGKAPHQHSFVHGGVAVAPTVDKINRALALLKDISEFVKRFMIPDTELIARVYSDYYQIGLTPRRLLSFGLFKFGTKNETLLWRSGVLVDNRLTIPRVDLIEEDVTRAWFRELNDTEIINHTVEPDPYKQGAYTWVKSVRYAGQHFQGGPLARMIITGRYRGGTSTMDRIYARSLETLLITELIHEWLTKLVPGEPPISQKDSPVKSEVITTSDVMRGPLLHSARIANEQVEEYNIITPTAWNFSPKDLHGNRGPVESALVSTEIPRPDLLFTILGRTVRSFDPCLNCGTHVLDAKGNLAASTVF
jgi:hydrogenase large subunit